MSSEIKNNIFDGQSTLPVLAISHSRITASDLFIVGGAHDIHHNIFQNARNRFKDFISVYAPNFLHYLPPYYFDYA